MIPVELKQSLEEFGLSQVEFARMLGVTPRAVSMWLQGDREIPGPVDAYVRVFRRLSIALREDEKLKAAGKDSVMKEGMYRIEFRSGNDQSNWGVGTLVFDGGRIFGFDEGRAKYDGEYQPTQVPGLVSVKLKVTFPPHSISIFGIAHPHEWAIEVRTQIDANKESGQLVAVTNLGHSVEASYAFIRSMPEAA